MQQLYREDLLKNFGDIERCSFRYLGRSFIVVVNYLIIITPSSTTS